MFTTKVKPTSQEKHHVYWQAITLASLGVAGILLYKNKKKEEVPLLYVAESGPPKTHLVGGKSMNLYQLGKIQGITVPKWFCLTTALFDQFLRDNHLVGDIQALNGIQDEAALFKACTEIQKKIVSGNIHPEQMKLLRQGLSYLGEETAVAVRSSAAMEDSSTASFAGLYDSFLNRKGVNDVAIALKQVWASTFNPRAVAERIKKGHEVQSCQIAVIVQNMVPAIAAGVATSLELSTNYPGIEISANFGTGESVVGGEVSVDKWLVHPTQNYVIKFILGNKTKKHVCVDHGTHMETVPETEQQRMSLRHEEALEIAKQVRLIKAHYQTQMDTEFAIDTNGKLFFVQARPLVTFKASKVWIVDPEEAKKSKIIARGSYSVPGVAHGTVRFIQNWEDLTKSGVQIAPEDIVVTYVASNYWSHYLSRFKGLITKQGSPTAHPILLCRERQVPCVIGIEDEFEALRSYDGAIVTIDGTNRVIYAGKVGTKEASQEEMLKGFSTVKVKEWPSVERKKWELLNANLLIEHEGKLWFKTPSFAMRRLLQEVNLKRVDRASEIVGRAKNPAIETRVIHNFTCFTLNPFDETVQHYFGGMALEECEQFSHKQRQSEIDFLQRADRFTLTSDSWKKYINGMVDQRSYILLGGVFRAYVERQVELQAARLEIPQHYLDEYAADIQSRLVEEDTCLQESLFNFANKLRAHPRYPNIERLQKENPELYKELETLGETFRFDRDASLEKPKNLELAYKKALLEVAEIENGKQFMSMKRKSSNEVFFPTNPFLQRWMELSITNRVMQSNAHHYLVRGQWKAQKELLALGSHLVEKGVLQQRDQIFDLSIDEIDKHIRTLIPHM